uniref:Peptidase A2 domain-containing protein n=1 Tax=Strigamia maritima TaxID=126957 RepID=T1II65_STRMM
MTDEESFHRYYEEMEAEQTREVGENTLVAHDIMGVSNITPLPHVERIPSSKLMTCQGYLIHPDTGIDHPVNIMLDPGASVSLISERAACILGLRASGAAETAFSGVGGKTSEFKLHKIYTFKVKSSIKDSGSIQIMAYEHSDPLTGPEREFELSSKDRQYIKKHRLESGLLVDSDRPPDVLIGLDESLDCMSTGQKPIILPSGMKLQPTIFGFIRSGAVKVKSATDSMQCLLPETIRMMHETSPWDPHSVVSKRRRIPSGTMNCDLVNQVARTEDARNKLTMENLSRFLSADLAHTELERDLSDEEVRQHFKETVQYEEGKGYTVRWARKPGIENLPSNLHIAFQRLLHHKALWNQSVRSTVQEAFRARPRVAVGDVEKAFHTVKLNHKDRDLCRFLWFKEGAPTSADNPYHENIIHIRFVVVPFGVNQSPFLLNSVIAHHMEKKVEELKSRRRQADGSFDEETTRIIQLCRDIMRNLYVDNVCFGTSETSNLSKDMVTAKALFKEMEMNLRQFLTSDPATNRTIPPNDRAGGEEGSIKIHCETSVDSKRRYVSEITKIFDPCGWYSPITLPLKRVMQKLCSGTANKDWNRKLTEEEMKEASECLRAANGFRFSMPRYTGPSMMNNINGSLVVFCDSSDLAYAGVVYMLADRGEIILAKSRLLPLTKPGSKKTVTTPQGELRAVVLGLNLLLTSLKALVNYGAPTGIHRLICLTDSMITYHRIMSRRTETMRQMSLFVRNRLLEINRLEDEILSIPVLKGNPLEKDPGEKRCIEFSYVPTAQNPSDLATRGTTANELEDLNQELGQFWWTGSNNPQGLMETIASFPST